MTPLASHPDRDLFTGPAQGEQVVRTGDERALAAVMDLGRQQRTPD